MNKLLHRLLCLALASALLGSGLLLWAKLRESKPDTALPVEHTVLYRAEGIQSASPSVLLLSHPGDGGRYLARELNRRGVHVLLTDDASVLPAAWDYLVGCDFARLSSLCLMARGEDIPSALSLLGELSGNGKEPAAVVLCGSDVTVCGDTPGRDLLFLSGKTPDADALASFYGDSTPAEKISGYFADGDARKVSVVSGAVPRWGSRSTMTTVFDWLGSSLGHVVELPDTDLAVSADRSIVAGGTAALCLALCALAARGILKHRTSHKENS